LLVLAENVLDVPLISYKALRMNGWTPQQISYRLTKRECNKAIFRRVEAEYGASSINLVWLQPDLNTATFSSVNRGAPCLGAKHYTITEMKTIAIIEPAHVILGSMEWPQSHDQDAEQNGCI
jgi:hypothetical protein